MNTIKLTRYLPIFCLLFVFLGIQNVEGQLKDRIKKKLEDKVVDKVDEGLNGKKKKKKKNKNEEVIVETSDGTVNINRNFIDRSNTFFYDDFDTEAPGEFPSKWTQIKGTLENGQFTVKNKKEGVLQMVSTYSTLKPTFDIDDYLGDSFKMEVQMYFWNRGNEAYVVQLHGGKSSGPAHSITLRSTNVASGSDGVVYKAGKQSPGWSTAQISFNKGNLKVIVDGAQLVNNPDINIREFTYFSLYTLSPGSNRADGYAKARINYVMISKEGLPLYDRLVSSGRIVVRDIYFDVDKYIIKPESYPSLDKIVTMLKEHDNMEVTVEGHTDATGTEDDNQILSENRAEAVKIYLISKGIKRNRLSSKGYGEDKLISKANNKDAHAQNRRVEFVMVKQ